MLTRTTIAAGVFAVGVLGLSGCGEDPAPRLTYETREVQAEAGDCDEQPAGPCAVFSVTYPEFSGAAGAPALNHTVLEMLVAPETGRASTPDAFDAMAREFIEGWERMQEEFPDTAAGAGWFSERHMEIIHSNDRVVTVRLERSEYTGGAHPNSAVALASFALPAGTRLTLADVLIDGHEATLDEIAERAFRQERGLSPDADLSAEGYWFEDGRFAVNENFSIDRAGLRFHFGPYEVAPYATGPIEFVASVDELTPLLRPGGTDWFLID